MQIEDAREYIEPTVAALFTASGSTAPSICWGLFLRYFVFFAWDLSGSRGLFLDF